MIEETFKEKAATELKRHEDTMLQIARECASAKFKESGINIGDIVVDDCDTRIIVEKVGFNVNTSRPQESSFRLIGLKLKKDNSPRKDGSKDTVYQHRIVEIISNKENAQ